MIERRGKNWVVLSEAGKVLGEHDNEQDAINQLYAIEMNRKGYSSMAEAKQAAQKSIAESVKKLKS